MVQDDKREEEQVRTFGLKPWPKKRSNTYIPDATIKIGGKEYNIELKTYNTERGLVSTARNVTLEKISRWEEVYWVFSEFEKAPKSSGGFRFTGNHYFGDKHMLKPWFDKQREKLLEGTKTYGGLRHWNQAKKLLKGSMDKVTIDRLDNTIRKKGGLNDPSIPRGVLIEHCVKLDNDDLQGSLVKSIGKNSEK